MSVMMVRSCPRHGDVFDGVQFVPCQGPACDDIDQRCPHCDHVRHHPDRMVVRVQMRQVDSGDVMMDVFHVVDMPVDDDFDASDIMDDVQ